MPRILLLLFTSIVLGGMLCSCDDETGSIGVGIMPPEDLTTTSQQTFDVWTNSLKADSLIAFTSECYLGRLTDPETNATTTADFLAQFATLEDDNLPAMSVMHKENGQVVADSIVLNLYIKTFYGDSTNSIKIGVYELDKNNVLPENHSFYTNLRPEQYVSQAPDAVRKEQTFSVVDFAIDDTIRYASNYSRNIRIKLDASYGTKILQAYYQHPEYFKNSYSFIRNVVPGFYFKTLAGNGTLVNIDVSTLTIFFRYTIKDKEYVGIKRVAATAEVIQCNSFDNRNLAPLIENNNFALIKSPAAVFTEIELPIDKIYANHENDSINSAKIVFQRINNTAPSTFSLPAPNQLLLVRKADLYKFFEERRVPDGITSFTTAYAPAYNSYTFQNISSAISYLHRLRNKEAGVKPTDSQATIAQKIQAWESKPGNSDWNKMVLVPIVTNQNSLGNIIDVFHDFSLSSTKLVGGQNPNTISVVYSSFQK